jgi:uridine kinase
MLVEALPGRSCAVVCVDHYFRDWGLLPDELQEPLRSHNRPDTIRWGELKRDMTAILDGECVAYPVPGTGAAARAQEPWTVAASDVLILEGLYALSDEELLERFDLRVFVDVPDDERVLRRVGRDLGRGGNIDRSTAWYRRDVAPGYHRFVGPTRWRADLIVPNIAPTAPPPTVLRPLIAAVEALLAAR